MKSDILFDAIGELPDEYVQDARPATVVKRKVPWGVWAAAAACLVVAVLIAVPLLNGGLDAAVSRDAIATNGIVEGSESAIAEGAMEAEAAPEEGKGSEAEGAVINEDVEDVSSGGTINVSSFFYDSYDEFAANVSDPVFEALASSELLQDRDVMYTLAGDETSEGTLDPYQITIYLDASTRTTNYGFARPFEESAHYEDSCPFPKVFDQAEEKGTLTTYSIDGIEIEKCCQSDVFRAPGSSSGFFRSTGSEYNERININGTWYYVFGNTESETDGLAAALADIASQL